MTLKNEDGSIKVSWHVAIWILTLSFMFGVFIATLEARDYTHAQVRELRIEMKDDLRKIQDGIEKISTQIESERRERREADHLQEAKK